MQHSQVSNRRTVNSWILYDWANSVFSTTVMAGFFPVLFKEFWAKGVDPTLSTWFLGLANSLSSAFVILAAPIIGALADVGNSRRRYLFVFTFFGCLGSFALAFIGEGRMQDAAIVYGFAAAAFHIACAVYDSLLKFVSDDTNADRISAAGYAIGYLGGGLLFAVNLLMFQKPHWFGFTSGLDGALFSFVTVALWWMIFSVPTFLWVPERNAVTQRSRGYIREAFHRVYRLIRSLPERPSLGYFFLAYWFYIDGVYTVVKMAIDYGVAIGFQSSDLIVALLVTQFVGFPAAIVFGRLGERFGPKPAIMFGLIVYAIICVWATMMSVTWEFYALAVLIGLVQGGVQSLSRSLFLRLVPEDQASEYFGFFNLIGKFSSVFGPLLVGGVAYLTSSSRLGIASLILLFLLGSFFLRKVRLDGNGIQ